MPRIVVAIVIRIGRRRSLLPTIYTLLDDANLNLRKVIRRAREKAPLAPKPAPAL
jgi:hypothetical protein